MRMRRFLAVTAADSERTDANAFLERLLPVLVARRRVRPVLLLGRSGADDERLTGFGPVLRADDLDDWWGPRLVESLGWRRDHRQLRAFRARWWRLRLWRAPLLVVSGPVPVTLTCTLRGARRAAAEAYRPDSIEQPGVPVTGLPPLPDDEATSVAPPVVVGIGSFDGDAGIDLWLRTVHALESRGVDARFVWFRTGDEHERTDGVDHECWHLGLDDVDLVRPHDWFDLADQVAGASVLLLSARPGTAALAAFDECIPGGDWSVRSGHVPIVGFAGAVTGVDELTGARAVEFPDVDALADEVAATASREGADRRRLAYLDAALDHVLAGAVTA